MRFKKGDKVIVKGLTLPFVFESYLNDNLAKIFIEGESWNTQHSMIEARPAVLMLNNTENCIEEGWIEAPAPRSQLKHLGDIFTFDEIIEKFRTKEWTIDRWNFCIHRGPGGKFDAYIMGEGSEQCLTDKHGFATEKEIKDLYHSLGVKYILPI